MNEDQVRELLDTVRRLEAQMQRVLAFVDALQELANTWTSGGRGKMLATLARMKAGGS